MISNVNRQESSCSSKLCSFIGQGFSDAVQKLMQKVKLLANDIFSSISYSWEAKSFIGVKQARGKVQEQEISAEALAEALDKASGEIQEKEDAFQAVLLEGKAPALNEYCFDERLMGRLFSAVTDLGDGLLLMRKFENDCFESATLPEGSVENWRGLLREALLAEKLVPVVNQMKEAGIKETGIRLLLQEKGLDEAEMIFVLHRLQNSLVFDSLPRISTNNYKYEKLPDGTFKKVILDPETTSNTDTV